MMKSFLFKNFFFKRDALVGLGLKYIRNVSGAIAVVFALMAPLIIASAGMALDYAHAYLVQQRLAQAIDAAALAAAASSTDTNVIRQKVQDFFDMNYSDDKLGLTFEPNVQIVGSEVVVTGSAQYDTFFLDFIGIHDITVNASTTVIREIKGLEVVLVLDNTGSMGTDNNIGKLRTASCEFVEILFGTYDSEQTNDCLERYDSFVEAENDYVKVGLVPYSTSVNVGPYGLGYDDDGYVYGSAFLNNPQGLSFSNDSGTDICVLEADDGTDVTDYDGPWDMYRWCRDNDTDYGLCNTRWDYECTSYNSSHSSCRNWNWREGWRGVKRGPNYICPKASVLPLTGNMTNLKDRIREMQANGNTYGNIGMVWGWRVLSPGYPFTEGVGFDNTSWRKVVVMMTDGDNVRSSNYDAYGRSSTHSIDSSSDLDDRLVDVCDNMHEQENLTVYTITFEASSGGIDSSTKQIYKDCAYNGGYHRHVTTSDELINVFRDIAQELSNLHIKG